MRRVKTGYYDRTGKAIRDGDKLKAIFVDGTILDGFVDTNYDGEWILNGEYWVAPLHALDDVEILEDE